MTLPIRIKSPITLQKEPMPGYSTGQSILYLMPFEYEYDLEVIASGFEPLKMHRSTNDNWEEIEIHLAPQIKM